MIEIKPKTMALLSHLKGSTPWEEVVVPVTLQDQGVQSGHVQVFKMFDIFYILNK